MLVLRQSAVQKAEIVLHLLRVLLDLSKGNMEARQILLNGLRELFGERQHELLLLDVRPDVVVDLAVFSPRLEAQIVVNLEEMIAHLVVRQNLRVDSPSFPHHRVVSRRQRGVHPVPVVVVPLHHLVRALLLQPALKNQSKRRRRVLRGDRSWAGRNDARAARSALCSLPAGDTRRSCRSAGS